jgi:hypothetical protein
LALIENRKEQRMSKLPPVPPDNQSHMGTGDTKSGNAHQVQKAHGAAGNADEQGHTGNIKQNTTHQGHQQDR